MLIILLVMFCSLLVVPSAKAELVSMETPRSGLEFQVGNNFQLESFLGSMFSWKRLSSEHRGWRVGLSPGVGHESLTYYEGIDFWRSQETDSYSFDVVVQKLMLGSLNQKTRSYWGIGPMLGFLYGENKESFKNSQEGLFIEEIIIHRIWKIGVSAVVGVEYFILPNISFHGEYGFDFEYKIENYSRSNRFERQYLQVSSRNVRLGLSVLY